MHFSQKKTIPSVFHLDSLNIALELYFMKFKQERTEQKLRKSVEDLRERED